MKECALALGTFDGMHKGHVSVIKAARESGFEVVALTFHIPPKFIISGEKPELLMTAEAKEKALAELGVIRCDYLDFNEVCQLSPKEFLDLICEKYPVKMISCGFNYRFGKNGEGDTKFLREYCREKGITVHVARARQVENEIISSSLLRQMIKDGRVADANKLLYKPFSFFGPVVHGDARGRTLGFPTVNQNYSEEQLVLPKAGVYAGETYVGGKRYHCVTNIGFRPTYAVKKALCETYIIDFDTNLYDTVFEIRLKRFLRSEKKFSSVKELQNAIAADVEKVREDML